MNIKKSLQILIKKKWFPLLLFIILFVLIAVAARWFDQTNALDSFSSSPEQSTMTFRVTIPENTLAGDVIYLYPQTQEHYRMSEIENGIYQIVLREDQLQPDDNGDLRYRYSRNGSDFNTAEFLLPDTNDYFWEERGRKITYKADKVQTDTVQRWRWFPEGDVDTTQTTALTPDITFQPRVSDITFRSGQIIEDFYTTAFDEFMESTADHMVKMGYNWAEIDPPWQWMEEDGLPKVVNDFENSPNYPDDESLIKEIRAYKEKGLKVMMQPQLCCTAIDTENQSDAWWDAYFEETTKFLVHHADIAEAEGVDAIHYALGHEYWEDDYAQRWSSVFSKIREHFSGEIGEMVWSAGTDAGNIHPEADFITWGDDLDYFYIAIDAPISTKDNPTDAELLAGAEKMLDGVKQLYDTYGKPVVVRTTYFNVTQTWKGNSFYDISSVPGIWGPESDLVDSVYELNPTDQARTINAYFKAIATRPWIIGYSQFGYMHWEMPLSPDLSVRGKESEDLWRKWNEVIFSD